MPTDLTWRAQLDASNLKAGLAGLAQAGQAAMGSVADASQGAAAAVDKLATPTGTSTAAMARLQRQADQLRASVDPLAAAQVRFAQETDKANRLLEKGAIDAQLHAKAMDAAKGKLAEATKEFGTHSASVGVNRAQMMELSHVARSVFDGLAAGASPLRVLTMEGGRVAQVMGEGNGGMAGSLNALRGFLSPTTVLLLGMTAALAAGAAAAFEASRADAQLANSIIGIGAASGESVADLNRIADATAAAGEGSVTFARQAEAAFLRAGVTSENMQKAVGLVEAFAAVSGEKAPEALKQLAQALADPAKGVETLGNGILNLSEDQIRHIRLLDEQGQHTAAVSALVDAIGGAVEGARPHLTDLGEGFAHLTGFIMGSVDALGHFLDRMVHVAAAEKLAQLKAEKARIEGAGSETFTAGVQAPTAPGRLAEVNKEIAALQVEVAGAAAKPGQAKENVQGRRDQELIDRAFPQAKEIRDLRATIDGLKDVLKRTPPGTEKYAEAQLGIKKAEERIDRYSRRYDPRPARAKKGPADQTASDDATAQREDDSADKDLAEARKEAAAAARKIAEAYTVSGRLQAAEDEAEATRQAARASADAALKSKIDALNAEEAKLRAAKNDGHKAEQLALIESAKAKETEAAATKKQTADAEAAYATEKAARDAAVQAYQDQVTLRNAIRSHYDAVDQTNAALAPDGAARRAAEAKVLANQEAAQRAALNDSYELQRRAINATTPDGAQQLSDLASQQPAQMAALNDELAARRRQFNVGQLNPLAADARQESQVDPLQTAEADVAQGLHGLGAELVAAARQGQSFAQVIGGIGQKITDKILGDMLDKYLTGPLEGWLGSIMPQTAATATAATATSAMTSSATAATAALTALAAAAQAATLAQGGGGGGFGSFFGNLFGGGGSAGMGGAGLAGIDGNAMDFVGAGDAIPFFRAGGRIPGFAGGGRAMNGRISGPGTGVSDSILAMVDGRDPIRVSKGETIVNAAASQRFGHVLDAMNRGALRGYADGGMIGGSAGPVSSGGGASGGGVTIIDNRTNGDPAPKVTQKPNGDSVISLESAFRQGIKGNPDAVRDAAFAAPPKVTRRGG